MKNTMVLMTVTALVGASMNVLASETSTGAMVQANPSASTKAVSFYSQGMTAIQQKNYSKALKWFEQALLDNPKNPDVLNMLAYSQRKVGRMDEAIANYHRALDLRPHFPEAIQYLSETYVEVGEEQIESFRKSGNTAKVDEAIANYRRALALTPNSSEAREYLGEAYVAAALDQVEQLKKSGEDAKEDLEDLANNIRKAAKAL